MAHDTRIQTDLARLPFSILSAIAAEKGVSIHVEAKTMLETAILAQSMRAAPQPKAEDALRKWLEKLVTEYRTSGNWDEHITLKIFDHIRAEQLATYEAAIADGNRVRINRGIGSLVARTLGAVAHYKDNGTAKMQQLKPGTHLITGYTLLYPKPY